MALATTCPQCKTSFKVVPDQLKLRRGLVRCGACQHVFSGIDYLRYVDESRREPAEGSAQPFGDEDLKTAFFLPETILAAPPTPQTAPPTTPPTAPPTTPPTAPPTTPPAPTPTEIADAGRGVPAAAPAPGPAEPGQAGRETAAREEAAPWETAPQRLGPELVAPDETWQEPVAPVPGTTDLDILGMGIGAPTTPEPPGALIDNEPPDWPGIEVQWQAEAAGTPTTAEEAIAERRDEGIGARDEAIEARDEAIGQRDEPIDAGDHAVEPRGATIEVRDEAAGAIAAYADGPERIESLTATTPARYAVAGTLDDEFADVTRAAGRDDDESAIDYFSAERRGVGFIGRHGPLALLGAALLVVALGAQWAIAQRSMIAARLPALAPVMSAMLAPFGLRVGPPRDLESLTIESFELQASATPGVLAMSALLRNRADYAVRWPSMQLTLTDPSNRVLVRKVLAPADYLREPGAGEGLPPRAEWPVRLALEADDLQPAGYSVILFYP